MRVIITVFIYLCAFELRSEEVASEPDPFGERIPVNVAKMEAEAMRCLNDQLIPGFEVLILNPEVGFLDADREAVFVFEGRDASEKIKGLTNELKEHVLPSEETECEDWIQIDAEVFRKDGLKVWLLFPDLPKDAKLPYYGIRVYDKDEAIICELEFRDQEGSASWLRLIREIQVANKDREAKKMKR